MEITYNTQIEVTENQYNKLMHDFSGAIAGRKEEGKYFIKVLLMAYVDRIKKVLN